MEFPRYVDNGLIILIIDQRIIGDTDHNIDRHSNRATWLSLFTLTSMLMKSKNMEGPIAVQVEIDSTLKRRKNSASSKGQLWFRSMSLKRTATIEGSLQAFIEYSN